MLKRKLVFAESKTKEPYIDESYYECLNSVKVKDRLSNDYVNSGIINQSSTKLLLNCSDGALRLYHFEVTSSLLLLVYTFEDAITR
jgi:hypothetical protein